MLTSAKTGAGKNGVPAGGLTDEQFRQAFEAVPTLKIGSSKEFLAECAKQAAILEDVNNIWDKRVKAVISCILYKSLTIDAYYAASMLTFAAGHGRQ